MCCETRKNRTGLHSVEARCVASSSPFFFNSIRLLFKPLLFFFFSCSSVFVCMVRRELNVSLSFFFFFCCSFEGVAQLSQKRVRGSGPMVAILHAVALFPPKKKRLLSHNNNNNNNNKKERIKKLQVVFIGLQAAVFSVIYSFISLLSFFFLDNTQRAAGCSWCTVARSSAHSLLRKRRAASYDCLLLLLFFFVVVLLFSVLTHHPEHVHLLRRIYAHLSYNSFTASSCLRRFPGSTRPLRREKKKKNELERCRLNTAGHVSKRCPDVFRQHRGCLCAAPRDQCTTTHVRQLRVHVRLCHSAPTLL